MKKVTLIIPVYNAELYIERCINSILSNTYKDYDLLLINDGSSDDSLKIMEKYEKEYDNITIVNQKNMGVANTRNKAIQLAKTKYIMFLDNDDYIANDYINTYVDAIEKNNSDVVIGGYQRVNQDGKVLDHRYVKNSSWGKFVIVSPWAKIYCREFLVKNTIQFLDYGIGEDIYFYLQILAKTNKIDVIHYIGYNWFYNTDSISNTCHVGLNKNIDILYLIDKCREKVEETSFFNKNILNYFYIRLIIYYVLYSGKNANSREFVLEYQRLQKYMNKNLNGYKGLVLFHTPLDEDFKFRIIMKIFICIDLFHMIPLFSKIYCKGREVNVNGEQ